MPGLTFHVPPVANPDQLYAFLRGLIDHGESASRETALEVMEPYLPSAPRWEIFTLARDIGLIDVADGLFILSADGRVLLDRDRWADIAHGLIYGGWNAKEPNHRTPLWTYRTVTDLLWDRAPCRIDSAVKRDIVEEIQIRADQIFAGMSDYRPPVSVGPKTIDGVVSWLAAASPAIVVDNQIQRRSTCPPALLALALNGVVREHGAIVGLDFRLGPVEREQLCRWCFISPDSLDRSLDWTISALPQLIRWGTTAAMYGRQIVVSSEHFGPALLG